MDSGLQNLNLSQKFNNLADFKKNNEKTVAKKFFIAIIFLQAIPR